MPAGRPSKIHETVSLRDPETGEEREVPITEAICRYVGLGSHFENAAQAFGVNRSTIHRWRARGAEWAETPPEDVPEGERPYARFCNDLTRAEGKGLVWHEINVRRAAAERREAGGRLSLEFLARRQPNRYSRRLEVDTDPGDREPAPVEPATVAEIEEAFDAAHVPEGIDPASILPGLEDGS